MRDSAEFTMRCGHTDRYQFGGFGGRTREQVAARAARDECLACCQALAGEPLPEMSERTSTSRPVVTSLLPTTPRISAAIARAAAEEDRYA